MACKYLGSKSYRITQEVGGSIHPEFVPNVPACQLNRLNRPGAVIGEVAGCENTESNGPCWWWLKEHGDKPDPRF